MQETNPKPSYRLSPFLLLLLISGAIGLFAAVMVIISEDKPLSQPASATNASAVQSRSLKDWQAQTFELTSLQGDAVSLTDYAGRVVFLNFWRTDCVPCVRELPAFQTFVNEQVDTGAVVLAINQGENAENIQKFLDEIGISAISVLLDEDLELSDNYPVVGLPTTYVVDTDGYVKYQKIGEMTTQEMYQYLEALAPQTEG